MSESILIFENHCWWIIPTGKRNEVYYTFLSSPDLKPAQSANPMNNWWFLSTAKHDSETNKVNNWFYTPSIKTPPNGVYGSMTLQTTSHRLQTRTKLEIPVFDLVVQEQRIAQNKLYNILYTALSRKPCKKILTSGVRFLITAKRPSRLGPIGPAKSKCPCSIYTSSITQLEKSWIVLPKSERSQYEAATGLDGHQASSEWGNNAKVAQSLAVCLQVVELALTLFPRYLVPLVRQSMVVQLPVSQSPISQYSTLL